MTTASTSIPYFYRDANPLLYSLRDDNTVIQPYFLFPLQFLFFDLTLRCWDRLVYGTWYLPGELIEIELVDRKATTIMSGTEIDQPLLSEISVYILVPFKGLFSRKKKTPKQILRVNLRKEAKEMTFDLYDIIFGCIPLFAHTIWYIIIHTDCSSAAYSSTWNCYNLFGYRIYNYIFDSYTDFAYCFLSKLYFYRRNKDAYNFIQSRKKPWRRILSKVIFWIAFVISIITFIFPGAIILPYLFTNVIPMLVIYAFISMAYAYVVTVVTLFLHYYTAITGRVFDFKSEELTWVKRQMKKLRHNPRFVISFGVRIFPYVMTIMFNLSQFIYYGGDFWTSLTREADFRDPSRYFASMSQASQIFHTILTTI
ncbi:unnamed protein product [Adineta ricciae]|uniref:Uncharacterized protein n=1 Tax=Adineta ricciae TaxID=249248 RepID=A0A815BZ27_ADIRI|nr:unnamed protein product [Adineta ricciae]CAF1276072.1 unnamed protein product [Adineta ricciae]